MRNNEIIIEGAKIVAVKQIQQTTVFKSISYLESLILKYLLYGHLLDLRVTWRLQVGLKHDTKRAISNNPAVGVLNFNFSAVSWFICLDRVDLARVKIAYGNQ